MSRKVKFLLIIISLATLTSTNFLSANATRKIPLKNPPFLSFSSFSPKNKEPEKTYIKMLEEKYRELQKALNNLKFKEITNEIEKMNNINNIENNYLEFYDAFKNILKTKQNYEENVEKASNLLKTNKIDLEHNKNLTENEEEIFEYIEKIIKIKTIITDEIEKQNKYIIKSLKDFFKNPETINNISSYFEKIIYEIKFNKESNKTNLINGYEIFKKQIPILLEEILKKIKNKPEEYNIKSDYIKFKYGIFESEEKTFEKTINLYHELFNKYEKKLKPIRESAFIQNSITKEREKLKEKLKKCSNNMENIIKNYEEAIENNISEKINDFEKEFEKLNKSIKTDIEDFIIYNRNSKLNLSKLTNINEILNLFNQTEILEYIFENLKTKKTFKNCFNQMKDLIENYKNGINRNDEGIIFSCEETFEKLYQSIKPDINEFVSQNIKFPLDISKQNIINRIHELIRKIDKLKIEYDNLKIDKKNEDKIFENIKLKKNLESCLKNMENLVGIYEDAINKKNVKLMAASGKKFEDLFSSIKPDIEIFVKNNPSSKINLFKKTIKSDIHKLIRQIGMLNFTYDKSKRKTRIDIEKNSKEEINLKTIEKNNSEKSSKEDDNEELKNILDGCFERMKDLINNYRTAINYHDEGIIFSCEETFEKLYKSIKPDMDNFVSCNPLILDLSGENVISKIHEVIKKIEDLKSSYDTLKKQKENNAISSDEEEELIQNNKKIIVENIEFCNSKDDEFSKNNDEEILGYWRYFKR